MAIQCCPHGHYYDNEKYPECPYCLIDEQDGLTPDEKTVAFEAIDGSEFDRTIGYSLIKEEVETRPVVGWVVCIEGPDRGRDWRLGEGQNFAGNSLNSDIVLSELPQGYEKLFSVIYDGRHKKFLVQPGQGAVIYHNDKLLTQTAELTDDDEISTEGTKLCFRSFCREKRYWS